MRERERKREREREREQKEQLHLLPGFAIHFFLLFPLFLCACVCLLESESPTKATRPKRHANSQMTLFIFSLQACFLYFSHSLLYIYFRRVWRGCILINFSKFSPLILPIYFRETFIYKNEKKNCNICEGLVIEK